MDIKLCRQSPKFQKTFLGSTNISNSISIQSVSWENSLLLEAIKMFNCFIKNIFSQGDVFCIFAEKSYSFLIAWVNRTMEGNQKIEGSNFSFLRHDIMVEMSIFIS